MESTMNESPTTTSPEGKPVADALDRQLAMMEERWEQRFRRHEHKMEKSKKYWKLGWAVIAALVLLNLISILVVLIIQIQVNA